MTTGEFLTSTIYMDSRARDLVVRKSLAFSGARWAQSPKMQVIYLDFGVHIKCVFVNKRSDVFDFWTH